MGRLVFCRDASQGGYWCPVHIWAALRDPMVIFLRAHEVGREKEGGRWEELEEKECPVNLIKTMQKRLFFFGAGCNSAHSQSQCWGGEPKALRLAGL